MYYSSYFCYLCSFSRFLSILRSSHTFFSYEYTKTYACHRQTTKGQQMFSLVQSCSVLYRPGQLVLQAQYNPHWYSLVQTRPVSPVGPVQSSLVQSCTDQASQSCRPGTILTGTRTVLYRPGQLVMQAQYNPHWYTLVQTRPVSHVGPVQSSLVQSCTNQASQSCKPSTILTATVLYRPGQLAQLGVAK